MGKTDQAGDEWWNVESTNFAADGTRRCVNGADAPLLPERTLAIHCYHIGQLDDSERRDPRYQGRGIGIQLLDFLIDWSRKSGFRAVIAKASPPFGPVMSFMGGMPSAVYLERGFVPHASWVETQLGQAIQERGLEIGRSDLDAAARVSCCILRF